jgi:hypothetical protein
MWACVASALIAVAALLVATTMVNEYGLVPQARWSYGLSIVMLILFFTCEAKLSRFLKQR